MKKSNAVPAKEADTRPGTPSSMKLQALRGTKSGKYPVMPTCYFCEKDLEEVKNFENKWVCNDCYKANVPELETPEPKIDTGYCIINNKFIK